jgi:hypothetical protein
MSLRFGLPAALAFLALGGCASIGGFPKPAFDQKNTAAELAPYLSPTIVTEYSKCPDKVECRNNILDARMRAVDMTFANFERALYREGIGIGVGTDWVTLALNAVGSVTKASKPLAAAAGAITGARSSYEKQALYNLTLPVMMAQMSAKRKDVLARVRQGETQSAATYSLFQGLNDVDSYEAAGTIPGAVADMITNAGVQAKQADQKLDAIRMVAPVDVSIQTTREDLAKAIKAATPAQLDLLLRISNVKAGDDPLVDSLELLDQVTTKADLDTFCTRFTVAVGAGAC